MYVSCPRQIKVYWSRQNHDDVDSDVLIEIHRFIASYPPNGNYRQPVLLDLFLIMLEKSYEYS